MGAIFVLLKKLFSMSIKGSGDEGRLHESLCTCAFDRPRKEVLSAASIIVLAEFRVQDQRMSSMHTHTQSPLGHILAVYCISLSSEHMVVNTERFRVPEGAQRELREFSSLTKGIVRHFGKYAFFCAKHK